jgi:hypothetical protein
MVKIVLYSNDFDILPPFSNVTKNVTKSKLYDSCDNVGYQFIINNDYGENVCLLYLPLDYSGSFYGYITDIDDNRIKHRSKKNNDIISYYCLNWSSRFNELSDIDMGILLYNGIECFLNLEKFNDVVIYSQQDEVKILNQILLRKAQLVITNDFFEDDYENHRDAIYHRFQKESGDKIFPKWLIENYSIKDIENLILPVIDFKDLSSIDREEIEKLIDEKKLTLTIEEKEKQEKILKIKELVMKKRELEYDIQNINKSISSII